MQLRLSLYVASRRTDAQRPERRVKMRLPLYYYYYYYYYKYIYNAQINSEPHMHAAATKG